MAPYNGRSFYPGPSEPSLRIRPSIAFITLILAALIAFEIFNYSTTDHALGDILGNLNFVGLPWSTILALAFCGIDFAGIARLFTPEQGPDEPKEIWYLFGAWLLAATMNAVLTWWGVSMAVANHAVQNSTVVDPQTMRNVIPIFVAVLVWVIRILIIGTLSIALDRYLNPQPDQRFSVQQSIAPQIASPVTRSSTVSRPVAAAQGRPAVAHSLNSRAMSAAPQQEVQELNWENEPAQPVRVSRPEPSYHSLSMSARSGGNNSGSQNNEGDSGGSGHNKTGTGSNRSRRF